MQRGWGEGVALTHPQGGASLTSATEDRIENKMTEPLLEYCNVEVSYNGASVVHDVSFTVMPGEILCIVGESGSGKSTLVKAAMGQLGDAGMVTQGDIWYEGASIPDMSALSLRRLCGSDFALVFQDCLAALTPIRRIGDQVYEGMVAHRSITRAECDGKAMTMLAKLGLEDPARVLESYPFNLSGGMGQRVGIAIALLSEPRILFADEPTSALDVIAQAQVVDLFRKINESLGTTIVLVTHNMGVVRAVADHVLVLKDGSLVEFGEAAHVLDAPSAAYTRELLDAAPRLERIEEVAHG